MNKLGEFYKVFYCELEGMGNAIILCSGGLDSVVSAYKIKEEYKELKFLFFDYGQRALKEEEYCAREIAKKLNSEFIKVKLDWLGEISNADLNKNVEVKETTDKDLEEGRKGIENWWVPCRNSIFIINALAFAESEFLKTKERYDVIVGIKDEGEGVMKDTTPEFLKKINELSEEGTKDGGYKVISPIIEMDKTEVIKLGKELKVPFKLTYSCYVGTDSEEIKHCGKCLNCKLRQKSFYWAGVEDVGSYREKV